MTARKSATPPAIPRRRSTCRGCNRRKDLRYGWCWDCVHASGAELTIAQAKRRAADRKRRKANRARARK